MTNHEQRFKFYVALLVAVVLSIVGGGGAALVVDDDGDGKPDYTIPIASTVDPIDPGPKISAPPEQVERAVEQAEATHGRLEHDHEGPGRPPTDEQVNRNETVAERDDVEGLSPTLAGGATFNQRGCRTIPISVNFSPRRAGVRPTLLGAAHITVSPEIPGWADVLGIGPNFFGRPGTGASSHYVIDREGHCAYIVQETNNAWTAGNMNWATACQIEMIGTPDDNGWHYKAGMRKAALVLRDCAKRWGIPIQLGNTSGCNVLRAGLVDHNELECGNDHWDICRTSEAARTGGSNACPTVQAILRAMRAVGNPLGAEQRKLARARCDARARVIAAPKGSTQRRAQLRKSRRARTAVRREIRRLDRAHKRGRPWTFHQIGRKRAQLAKVWTGKACRRG